MKKIPILSIYEISPIIEAYLTSKNPEFIILLKGLSGQEKLELLASTPQWTYVQIINTFLAAKYDRRKYELLLKHQTKLGLKTLPQKFSSELSFIKDFFKFELQVRQNPSSDSEIILKKIDSIPIKEINTQLEYLKKMIPILQEFELKTDNPNYGGSKKEDSIIKQQIGENDELYDFFINTQPAIKKILA